MTRSEWWALVCLGIGANISLLGILIYVRFIWDIQQKMWHELWAERLYVDTETAAELYLGNSKDRQRRNSPRDLYRPQG